MKMGCPTVGGPGILDNRIQINPGGDTLYSFALVAQDGRKKILWRSGGKVLVGFPYECKPKK